ncbi:DUF2339 domain-containing protein [Granulicella cerasi]|uniref:DUF2339 domain-containing protein n=1 Tax=Granulicella cerasi TaxID=741063 RepID=A0ABW1ZB98_9BACT
MDDAPILSASNEAALAERVARLETQVAALQRALAGQTLPVKRVVAAAPPPPTVAFASIEPAAPKRDLESRLGSEVLSKIAILLLLVGSAWFLKWAFDNRWVGPAGRVLIGLAAGSGLIVWSERFRRTGTPSFSYALKAVGTGVLYLSLWASFQLFHLVPAPVALLGMVLVTAWNATMAVLQESPLLAAYALTGAYLTPALLSSGGNHEAFLFGYLAAVAAAVLALQRARRWPLLLLGPLPATVLYVTMWGFSWSQESPLSETLCLTLILWAIFAAVPLLAADDESALVQVVLPLLTAFFGGSPSTAFSKSDTPGSGSRGQRCFSRPPIL